MLQKEEILDMMLKRLQGKFIGNYFIPNRTIDSIVYLWHYYGVIGGMTPEVGENDIGPLADTEYEERTGRVKFYRERINISDYTSRVTFRNVLNDKLDFLTDRMALRLEYLKVMGIVSNAYSSAQAENYYYHNCNTKGDHWIGGGGAVDILSQFIDGCQRASEYAKVRHDTAIMGTRLVAALNKSVEWRDWERKGPMSVQIAKEGGIIGTGWDPQGKLSQNTGKEVVTVDMPGSIGKIGGIEIFESNVSILADQSNTRSALQPLLDRDVYFFKRGSDLGYANVFLGIGVDEERIKFAHKTEYQIETALKVNIHRPQFIYTIKNAIKLGA